MEETDGRRSTKRDEGEGVKRVREVEGRCTATSTCVRVNERGEKRHGSTEIKIE